MSRIKLKTAKGMDIRDAVLDASSILPVNLRGYSAQLTADGEAYALKGGFALSIKIVKPNNKPICLRCWTDGKADESQIDYLDEVADIINKNNDRDCPYFIGFNIIEKLLNVDGIELPGLIMDWVEGETLNKYVMVNSGHSGEQIKLVAQKFAKMCYILNNRKISHGDLSAVNIIVKPDGNLKVIDYDSLYSPSMGRKVQYIAGIKDYQHPKRESATYYEAYMDYFSQHVIYVALLIMANNASARPTQQLKNLLFTESDFSSPSSFRNSSVVKDARKLCVYDIDRELDIIERALNLPLSQIPPLVESTMPRVKTIQKFAFCSACGNKFPSDEFDYCTVCGAKRNSYTID